MATTVLVILWYAGYGKESRHLYSLSDHVRIVASFNLESTVIGPEIDGVGDTRDASLVDLEYLQLCKM